MLRCSLAAARVLSLAVCAVVLTTPTASADAIYTYIGNAFNVLDVRGPQAPPDPYTTQDFIAISLRLDNPLGADFDGTVTPSLFLMEDGVNGIGKTTATDFLFRFVTDGSGAIVQWSVQGTRNEVVQGGGFQRQLATMRTPQRTVDFGLDRLCGTDSVPGTCAETGAPYYTSTGTIRENPGTWTVSIIPDPVPEPSSLALLGAAAFGLARRRSARV